jgi:ferredoxin
LKNKEGKVVKTLELKKDDLYNNRLKSNESILKLFLKNNLDVKYGCMGGSCGTCKSKLEKGQELVNKEGIRNRVYQDVNEDECLICISTIEKEDGVIVIKTRL